MLKNKPRRYDDTKNFHQHLKPDHLASVQLMIKKI